MAKGESKITSPDKIGPWRREDYRGFLALDCELKPPRREFNRLSGLLDVGLLGSTAEIRNWFHQPPESDRQRLIDEAWEVRRAHPIYQWLLQDPNFKAAWRVFELKRRKAAADSDLALPTAPFVFLHQFVELAGIAYDASSAPVKSKSGGYLKDRTAAIKHADALRELMSAGVSLDVYSDTRRLSELLQKLSAELRKTRRKKYGGKRAIERSMLKSMATMIHIRCGLRSPAIVTHFANMVGLKCDEKKAQRYVDEAASHWQKALAEAAARHASTLAA